jgi:hypothetical protein
LHKFVQNFVCLLLTYLAYICGWSQAAARYRTTHQSCARYSSTTTNQHVLLMSSTEGTPPHCAPTPTSLYNWSMSLWVLIIFFPKSSLMDFLQLYFLFSILNCTSGHSVIDGGWVISLSLSLSLSLTHTHKHTVNFFSSYEWMNEAREKCHSFLQYPKWRVLTLENQLLFVNISS